MRRHPTHDRTTVRFELLFNLLFKPNDPPAYGEAVADRWEPLPIATPASDHARLGAQASGMAAEFRRNHYLHHFEIKVGAIVTGEELPPGFSARVTVLDDQGTVRSTAQLDQSRGPHGERVLQPTLIADLHQQPARVVVRLYASA